MITESIPLRFAGSKHAARLRELTGRDEFAVVDTGSGNAISLISSLLENSSSGETEQLRAMDLVAADRDLLLAAVYDRAFGDRIESTLTCARCARPFDLHFSLQQLIHVAHGSINESDWKSLGDGLFETSGGVRFRLPTGRDELALTGLTAREVESSLLERCAAESNWKEDRVGFEQLLERVAPLLHLELVARCAECSHVHTVQFDIQSYVLGAIVAERYRLLLEVNRIAKAYSWSLAEILSLSRSDRRQIVEFIENDLVT